MKHIVSIFCFVYLLLSAGQCLSQSLVDSIIEQLDKQNSYAARLAILQEQLKRLQLSNYEESLALASLGYTLAYEEGDSLALGDFLRASGYAFTKKGQIDSASGYYFRALKVLEPQKNSKELPLLYDDMARLYRKLEQNQRALEFYAKALALYEKQGDLEGIARINNESGVVFRNMGDYQEATRRFEKSLAIQTERKDSIGIGYALEFLGYTQLLQKNYAQAQSSLLQALAIREKTGDKFALMLSYTALGEYHKELQDYQSSNKFFFKSNSLAKQIKFLDIQLYNFGQIMANYEALGNFREAYRSLKAVQLLNDSLYSAEKMNAVEELTSKYEAAEKEKLILLQKAKLAERELRLKNREQWIVGLSASLFCIAFLAAFLYQQQLLKQSKQQRGHERKLALEKIESQEKLHAQKLAIARDLHDSTGAQIAFLVSSLDALKDSQKIPDSQALASIEQLSEFGRATIKELRDSIWAMNKTRISLEDLEARIANFIAQAKQAQEQLDMSLQISEELGSQLAFSERQGLNIFRILQEASHNAIKHAQSDTIHISIQALGTALEFAVQDHGKGFVEQDTELGNGLQNMRKRASELGSQLRIYSEQGRGTRISFCLKLEHIDA